MKLAGIVTMGCLLIGTATVCGGMDAGTVIKQLNLVPMADEACPGYYLETYRSTTKAAVEKDRQAASLIYYFMTSKHREDPWHRISSDEILLYHAGAPMHIVLLYPDGSWKEFKLGPRFDEGQVAQVSIPANTWMALVLAEDPQADWGLYGVLVVPGWALADIEFVAGEQIIPLREKYPDAFKVIDERGWSSLKGP